MGNIIDPFGNGGRRGGPGPQIQAPGQIQVAACPVRLAGPMAQFHLDKYHERQKKTPLDAGFDLYGSWWVSAGLIHTGVTIFLPPNLVGLVFPLHNHGPWKSKISPGVVNSGSCNEITLQLSCQGEPGFLEIENAIREKLPLAQLVVTTHFFFNADVGTVDEFQTGRPAVPPMEGGAQ